MVWGSLEGDKAIIDPGAIYYDSEETRPGEWKGPFHAILLDKGGKELASQGFKTRTGGSPGEQGGTMRVFTVSVAVSDEVCARVAKVRVVRAGKVLGEASTGGWVEVREDTAGGRNVTVPRTAVTAETKGEVR
jgi:hypothetical protein